MSRECRERFPRRRGLENPTCIRARVRRMCLEACRDRSLAFFFEVVDGENVPGIPAACATRIFTYLVRGPLVTRFWNILYSCDMSLVDRGVRLERQSDYKGYIECAVRKTITVYTIIYKYLFGINFAVCLISSWRAPEICTYINIALYFSLCAHAWSHLRSFSSHGIQVVWTPENKRQPGPISQRVEDLIINIVIYIYSVCC